jgi:hypothetical protein
MNELVTILGTCRQKGIEKFYPVTNILEDVNYCYSTKEILQEIHYLKFKNIDYNDTKYCFRTGLLSKCCLGIDDNKYNILKQEFDKTSVFLIEIASRKCYKYNNLYLHSIASHPNFNFDKHNEIEIKQLTNEEIEHDIREIVKELYPKKLIILSHFASYKYGDRYELIKLLEKICLKLDIPFIDQTEILDKYGVENVIEKENKLIHYNEFGKTKIAELIKKKIHQINTRMIINNIEILINNNILDNFILKNFEYLFHQDYYKGISGINEYRLYSYLSTFFNYTKIIDIGTSYGRSAIALSHNELNNVITYDIINHINNDNHKIYSKKNIEFRIKNVLNDLNKDFISDCRLIIIDIDHFETIEKEILNKLEEIGFSGIIILDDIYHPDPCMFEAMQRLWKNIKLPKFDITNYGHSSGTGLILMNCEDIHLIFKA